MTSSRDTSSRREGERSFRVFTQEETRAAALFLWSQVSVDLVLPDYLFDGSPETVNELLTRVLFYYRDHSELTRIQKISLAYFLMGLTSRNFWWLSPVIYELMCQKVEQFRPIIDFSVFLSSDPPLPLLSSFAITPEKKSKN